MLRARYDSDEQSSMISEPGSPQDIPMSSDDEMADDFDMAAFSQSPESTFPSSSTGKPFHSSSSPWHARTSQSRAQRVPTPIIPHHNRPGVRPVQQQLRTALHMRDRHPQENGLTSSDNLEVPSPIDEDEVPTPPSAAEAAGSQLSMLTVNDMEMDPSPGQAALPTISVDTQQAAAVDEASESAIDVEPMDDALDLPLTVRKPRQRSGAVSSPSPIRTEKAQSRGFSMGFRADCEKCRLRVPGHMNHFVAS